MKNSKPISLDSLLNYPDEMFNEVAIEISKVIRKVKPVYIGKNLPIPFLMYRVL